MRGHRKIVLSASLFNSS